MEDSRGKIRGACNVCGCTQYSPSGDGIWKCRSCGHPPAKHQMLGARRTCRYPGCYASLDFDMNTGEEKPWCRDHRGYNGPDVTMQVQDVEYYDDCSYGVVDDSGGGGQPPSWGYQHTTAYPPTWLGTPHAVQAPHPGVVPAYTGYYPGAAQTGAVGISQIQAGMSSMVLGQTVQCSVPGRQKCAIPECPNPSYIDENGTVHKCCGRTHAKQLEQRQSQLVNQPAIAAPPTITAAPFGQAPPPPQTLPAFLPSGLRKCAIQECQEPCFIDQTGTVHECCGFTHAMELQRRKAIQQQKQCIKGITHCLLPECNQLVWPFKNYCGRTHADIGRQRGLLPPAPPADPNAPKDSSLCIIPGCMAKKHTEASGVTHPYCGLTHAELGKKNNILPTADKQEDECELPGCKAPKRKEGGRVHEYCCQSHAQQDAPNRDARILTSTAEVKKFLDGFSKLKGYTITDNQHAKPGGGLFNKFKQKWNSLPKSQRVTCLAFHGTTEKNIPNICQNGYDPKLRSGQVYGKGEYFATTPDVPIQYCRGGKKILLNELLLGQQNVHHTKQSVGGSTYIVMKYPEHDLPRFVVTFK